MLGSVALASLSASSTSCTGETWPSAASRPRARADSAAYSSARNSANAMECVPLLCGFQNLGRCQCVDAGGGFDVRECEGFVWLIDRLTTRAEYHGLAQVAEARSVAQPRAAVERGRAA